jgi:hypothetical protein
MNYKVRRQGVSLGIFSLDELRRRREGGEFSGSEYVQPEGMADWQPLDLVLQQGYRVTPPPLPLSVSNEPNLTLVWFIIIVGVVVFITFFGFIIFRTKQQLSLLNSRVSRGYSSSSQGVAAASKPVSWNVNTLTVADVQRRSREFRTRQWLSGYEKRGQRNDAVDAEAEQFIRVWIARNYGGAEATNALSLGTESDKLAVDPNCTDPLIWTIAADNSLNQFDAIHRYERALAAYPGSRHKAYPKFYANVRLAWQLGDRSDRSGALTTSALQLFSECFADGSFTPADQQEIAEIFVNGWGYNFFQSNAASVCAIAHQAGPGYQWLSLTLDGEHEIIEAWAARGDGYASTVSGQGWQGFSEHLKSARMSLTQAWNLQPDFPLAPCRMMTVALGDSGIDEMRVWFDRTVTAQIDYPGAWVEMRWGFRPRWYGSYAAMLAFGKTAIKTGRFDTDVPRKFFDCVSDLESEMELPAGRHIYGRADIWPHLRQMYDGYLAASSQAQYRAGWRTSYAVVAYFAKKYDVARTQLEALDWKLSPQNLTAWNVDLSLMPLEVAARTGSLGKEISDAEASFSNGDISSAQKKETALDIAGADARTKEFIQLRLTQLAAEQRLHNGEWVDLLPASDHDPDWVFSFGKARRLPDGALEVESGPQGHMFYSRLRAGANFEVRGQFENVRSSNKNFQGGLVMGVPDFNSFNWYSFRIKRHDEEGDVVSFARNWSREQIVQHIVLNDVTNSFDFIFQNDQVTASVNGVEVFHQAAPPAAVSVPDNSYLIGLGAFSDSADSVIRYRNVQVRQLH